MGNIRIHRIPLGSYECNCYLVHNTLNNNAVIIDCGDGEELMEYLNKNNLELTIKYGLLTHGHFDHANGVKYIQDKFGTMFFMALPDFQAQHEQPYLFSELENINFLYEDSHLNFGEFQVDVFMTPGHTKGGVTYRIGEYLFTGDTLFRGTIGRTDLYGGNFDTLISSIRNKLFTLPDSMIVCPGHGEESTIGEEKISNRFRKDIIGEEGFNE